jgi:hypothetical protein
LAEAQGFKLIELIKNKVIGYVQDYLVNRFLKSVKASRAIVLAVNAALSIDAISAIRIVLSYYGIGKFLDALFLLSIIM